MRADREIACNAEVVKLLGRGGAADYGRTILKLAEHASAPRFFAGRIGIIEVKSETGKRIIMISQHRKQGRARAMCGLTIATIIAVVSFTEAQSQTAGTSAETQKLAVPDGHAPVDANQPTEPNYPNDDLSKSPAKSPKNSNATAGTLVGASNPFSLKVADENGELIYTLNETTQELETISAKRGVVYSTEGTTISCAELTYTSSTQQLVAKGPGLEVRLPKAGTSTKSPPNSEEIVVTADLLNYDLTSGTMDFDGNVVIEQGLINGKISKTTGDHIQISTRDGLKMKFKAGGRISMNYLLFPKARAPLPTT